MKATFGSIGVEICPSLPTMDATDAKYFDSVHIDDVETFKNGHEPVVGSHQLITNSEIVLIPTPTNDPNGKTLQYFTSKISYHLT